MFKGDRPLIYFAAPLFSEAELSFNTLTASALEHFVDVYLPQRDGGRLVDLVSKGVCVDEAYESIFSRDIDALRESDALVIVLDGRTIDEGAVFELGVAYATGKLCVGFQTDPRRLLPIGNNPMVACALAQTFNDLASLTNWARDFGCLQPSPLQNAGTTR